MRNQILIILCIIPLSINIANAQDFQLMQRAFSGEAEAQTELGLYYAGKKDYERAGYWWHKAAEQNPCRNLCSFWASAGVPNLLPAASWEWAARCPAFSPHAGFLTSPTPAGLFPPDFRS